MFIFCVVVTRLFSFLFFFLGRGVEEYKVYFAASKEL